MARTPKKSLASYEHVHAGVLSITWDDVARICRRLTEEIEPALHPEVIVGIAKGGAIPGAIIASMLRRDFFPVRITRREADVVTRENPALVARIPAEVVRGKRVLVADDIAVTGATLRVAVDECWAQGATEVKTAALYRHSYGVRPDWCGLETDDLVVQPWDVMVFSEGRWRVNREYSDELTRMGLSAEEVLVAYLLGPK